MIIDVELNDKSIDEAIKSIEEYQDRLLQKTGNIVDELAREVDNKAYAELTRHVWSGETISSLHIERKDTANTRKATVKVGGAAIWLEFGTGVVANGCAVGDYIHPMASELGMMGIGTYGNGHGADPDGWYWEDEIGEYHHTYGIPATMFMWNAAQSARQKMPSIARRVFVR